MEREYPFGGLLRIRRVQLEDAGQSLLNANRKSRDAHSSEERARHKLAHYGAGNSSMSTLLSVASARITSAAMLSELANLTLLADMELADAKENYTKAKQAVVPLEKLEERHNEELAAYDIKEEQKVLDEIASNNAAKTGKEGA